MMRAELVLPMPGGPLSSTARLVMSLGLPPPFGNPSGASFCMWTRSLLQSRDSSSASVHVPGGCHESPTDMLEHSKRRQSTGWACMQPEQAVNGGR